MRVPFLLLLFFVSLPVFADVESGSKEILQDDLTARETGEEHAIIQSRLLELYFSPLDLNTVVESELLGIPAMTAGLAGEIVRLRETMGFFTHVSQIRSVLSMDTDSYERIKPFLRVVKPKEKNEIQDPVSLNISFSISSYPFTNFNRGIPADEKWRMRLDAYRVFRLAARWNSLRYLEPDRFYLQLHGVGPVQSLVLGHYRILFGQGLLVGSSGPGKTGNLCKVRNTSGVIVAGDLSSYMNRNYFGIASHLQLGTWSVVGFSSWKGMIATVEDAESLGDRLDDKPDDKEDDLISVYQPDAFGVPSPGLEKRSLGMRISTSFKGPPLRGNIGISFLQTDFPLPLSLVYSADGYYAFTGEKIRGLSCDIEMVWKSLVAFCESAMLLENPDWEKSGIYSGVEFGQRVMRSVVTFRRYGNGFHGFDNDPFSEYGVGKGETGFYAATMLRPTRDLFLQFGADLFRKDWICGSGYMAPFGWELSAELRKSLASDISLRTRFSTARREKYVSGEVFTGHGEYREYLKLRMDLEWKTGYRIAWRTGWDMLDAGFTGSELEQGDAGFFEGEYLFSRSSRIAWRMTLFSVSKTGLLYMREEGIPGLQAFVSHKGTGLRHYLFVSHELPGKKNLVYGKISWQSYFKEVGKEGVKGDGSLQLEFQVTAGF